MRANSNAIRFFPLNFAEKSGWRQHQFFLIYLIETSFHIKCLISEKQCGFSLAQNHKSQSSTRHIWELGKSYTINEVILFLAGCNIHRLHGHIFTHICAQFV